MVKPFLRLSICPCRSALCLSVVLFHVLVLIRLVLSASWTVCVCVSVFDRSDFGVEKAFSVANCSEKEVEAKLEELVNIGAKMPKSDESLP